MNTTFTLFFTIECSLKLISFGGRVTANYGASLCFKCFCPCPPCWFVLWSDKFLVIVCCHCSSRSTYLVNMASKDTLKSVYKCPNYNANLCCHLAVADQLCTCIAKCDLLVTKLALIFLFFFLSSIFVRATLRILGILLTLSLWLAVLWTL